MKKSFKFHGLNIKIKPFTPDEQTAHVMGYATKKPLEVHVNNTIPEDEVFATIVHEMSHCMMFRIGLDQVLTHEMQEILCENFSQLARDNFTWKK